MYQLPQSPCTCPDGPIQEASAHTRGFKEHSLTEPKQDMALLPHLTSRALNPASVACCLLQVIGSVCQLLTVSPPVGYGFLGNMGHAWVLHATPRSTAVPGLMNHPSAPLGSPWRAPKGKRREDPAEPSSPGSSPLQRKEQMGFAALSFVMLSYTLCFYCKRCPQPPPVMGIWVFASLNRLCVSEKPGLGLGHFNIPHIIWAEGWHSFWMKKHSLGGLVMPEAKYNICVVC